MKILVTGGAGLIGSHLCEKLIKEGHTVFCLDNLSTGCLSNVEGLTNNSRFIMLVESVQRCPNLYVDQIYHLASPASPIFYDKFPVETIEANVEGTKKVLELARKVQAQVLYTSTSEIYGDPEVHPQTEDYNGNVNPVGMRSCYDESKRCGETLCSVYERLYGVDIRIVRIFNTYGKNMRSDDGRVVSNFIERALTGKPLEVYGDGSQTRSFQYVDDLLEGFSRLMELSENPGPMNLGRPEEVTMRELAELILRLTGSFSSICRKPLPVDDPCKRKPEISKAKELLGWQPRISLEKGLQKVIDHFRERLRK